MRRIELSFTSDRWGHLSLRLFLTLLLGGPRLELWRNDYVSKTTHSFYLDRRERGYRYRYYGGDDNRSEESTAACPPDGDM